MIHSLSGGVIASNDSYDYAFVELLEGLDKGTKRWFISPFPKLKQGDEVIVPVGRAQVKGKVVRIDRVTKQTAPFPVNRTAEIERIL